MVPKHLIKDPVSVQLKYTLARKSDDARHFSQPLSVRSPYKRILRIHLFKWALATLRQRTYSSLAFAAPIQFTCAERKTELLLAGGMNDSNAHSMRTSFLLEKLCMYVCAHGEVVRLFAAPSLIKGDADLSPAFSNRFESRCSTRSNR